MLASEPSRRCWFTSETIGAFLSSIHLSSYQSDVNSQLFLTAREFALANRKRCRRQGDSAEVGGENALSRSGPASGANQSPEGLFREDCASPDMTEFSSNVHCGQWRRYKLWRKILSCPGLRNPRGKALPATGSRRLRVPTSRARSRPQLLRCRPVGGIFFCSQAQTHVL